MPALNVFCLLLKVAKSVAFKYPFAKAEANGILIFPLVASITNGLVAFKAALTLASV